MHIDSYSFGKIVVDGKEYTSDVIIFPDKIKNWWRKEGHEVYVDDIKEVAEARPEILIIGTGASGCMVVKDEVRKFLGSKKINLLVKPTKDACKSYNKLSERKSVIAALHLTC